MLHVPVKLWADVNTVRTVRNRRCSWCLTAIKGMVAAGIIAKHARVETAVICAACGEYHVQPWLGSTPAVSACKLPLFLQRLSLASCIGMADSTPLCVDPCYACVHAGYRTPFSVGATCKYLQSHSELLGQHSRDTWRRAMSATQPPTQDVERCLDWLLGAQPQPSQANDVVPSSPTSTDADSAGSPAPSAAGARPESPEL